VDIIGTRPLMLNSTDGYAPSGEIGERIRYLLDLNKRTEADNKELDKLKFILALYHDEKVGPYLPAFNLWAAGRDAAAIHRKKTAWIRGVQIVGPDQLPLQYDGPRSIDGLYTDPRFVDRRPAKPPRQGMIVAVRPIFPQWSMRATFAVDDGAISITDAKRAIELAGSMVGVGTFRQRFGRFDTVFVEEKSNGKNAANGKLAKAA
jgi:hypothetical protein